jgi:hypothetical protein
LNDLVIFVGKIGCQWKGCLSDFEMHMKQCSFVGTKVPEWYERYLKSKEIEMNEIEE